MLRVFGGRWLLAYGKVVKVLIVGKLIATVKKSNIIIIIFINNMSFMNDRISDYTNVLPILNAMLYRSQ
jgi:hypothetical protein